MSAAHGQPAGGDVPLANDEAQLLALLSASSDVIYRMSADWRQMRRLDGRSFLADARDSILWWDACIFPEDRPAIQAVIDAAIRTRSVFELEHRVRRSDGTPGWTFSRAIPVLDARGEIADWFGTATDVTARREAEAAMRAREERYRSLFDTMGQGYCDLRLLRDADGRAVDQLYLELNPAYERLIGIPVARAQGRKASEVMPALEPWWTTAFDRIARTGKTERIEHEVAALGRWFEVYVYPQDADHVTTLYEDITDRKRAEFALRESRARQAFLLKLADALRPLADPTATQTVAVRMLGQELAVDRCFYAEIDWANALLHIHHEYTRSSAASAVGAHPLGAVADLLRHGHGGRPLVCDAVATHPVLMGDEAAWRTRGSDAFILVPLVRQGVAVACIGVATAVPRTWTTAEMELVQDAAERTWSAVERTRMEAALRKTEERLRQFGDASQDVLWIRETETLQWRYLTPAFESIYGIARKEALAGDNYRNWLDLVVPEDRDHAAAMIRRAVAGEQVTFEYRVRRPADGEIRWLRNTDFPIYDDDGKVAMIGGIGHDATALHAAERRFRSLLEGIPQLVWRAVDGGEWTWASPQWTAYTGQAEVDSHAMGWLDRVHPDDRGAARDAWSRAVETGGFGVECRLRQDDGHYRWFSARATPVRDEAGAIVEWLGTSTDIDGLRRLQERQHILLAELQHRVRNIMAMIRSIARRTALRSDSVTGYFEHLEGRIDAMARTQALLTRAPGAGVDLQNLVRDELEAQSAKSRQYSCRGPDVALSPKAAEVLTLAIHELATNATKYGALGLHDGMVAIEWVKERRGGQDWLQFDWTELRVTPPPVPGQRRGFGTELVTRRVPYELKGHGRIEFLPTGLHARIEFPLVAGQSILQTDAGPDDRIATETVP